MHWATSHSLGRILAENPSIKQRVPQTLLLPLCPTCNAPCSKLSMLAIPLLLTLFPPCSQRCRHASPRTQCNSSRWTQTDATPIITPQHMCVPFSQLQRGRLTHACRQRLQHLTSQLLRCASGRSTSVAEGCAPPDPY